MYPFRLHFTTLSNSHESYTIWIELSCFVVSPRCGGAWCDLLFIFLQVLLFLFRNLYLTSYYVNGINVMCVLFNAMIVNSNPDHRKIFISNVIWNLARSVSSGTYEIYIVMIKKWYSTFFIDETGYIPFCTSCLMSINTQQQLVCFK